MAMTNEQFDEMVKRLEVFAKKEPAKYRFRVALLAVLGYAYIALVLVVLLSLFVLLFGLMWQNGRVNYIVGKIGWVFLVLAWVVFRSLWVKQSSPEGVELTRAEAPRLFDLIEELTGALDAPRIHHVLVLDFFNAAVVQVPRFGFFGGYKNYLLLGLPDMQAASPAQFRATLAHELGHLSGNHGRFTGWVYRLRQTWGQLLTRLEREQRWGSFFFTTFFNWYAPYFQAYSFVLARTHEYEADEAAARLTGTENVAEMLIDTRLKGSYLEESYWPEVYRQAETEPRPVADVYANLPRALGQPLPPDSVARQLNLALAEQTSSEDTHPALADRLRALGYPSPNGGGNGDSADWVKRYQPATVEESAADFYLGQHARTLIAQFDRAWQEGVAEQWGERHSYVLRSRQTLAALEEKARSGTLLLDEAWTRASLAAELKTPEEAIPLLRDVLSLRADHPAANFLLGQMLLQQNDAAGVAHLEQAAARDPDMLIPACQVLFAYFTAAGQPQEAERYRERAQKFFAKLDEAQPERAMISSPGELIPHEATPEEVERLREQLSPFPQIKAAYLAQKKLEKFPEKPLYVVGIVTNSHWYQLNRAASNRQLIDEIVSQVAFPGESLVVILEGDYKKMLKGFRKLEGAQIFP
ncbi:MAG TPA: M48 family metalloprotease [Pyrinomonadaceae bacterium]|nr:M48 family metalloprotease [Pyrinomonadaceae bacterium]